MSQSFIVAALYKFVALPDFADHRAPLLRVCIQNQVFGTLLLADEGINGTIAGPRNGIDAVLAHIRAMPGFAKLDHKESTAPANPFLRMKVRLKKEIVTLGVAGISPTKRVGQYIKPQDWNELISRKDVVLVDTRNDYEVEIGTFKGAIDPKTTSFREFPAWLRAQSGLHNKPKLAMFCTGGIRCEKSTSFALEEGFEEVYHLDGGILKYLETVPEAESLWQGECFVFDQRVSVDHQMRPGSYDLCHACRFPITDADKTSELYQPGISCPRCADNKTETQKARFAERQKQIQLAKTRGTQHLGQESQNR
ncbi:Rhodanese domain protein UPF0176 [hydrothermal vent metagenome]|uniref:Rhodanese domain protein UPF0176 n=1 Tax=hydrothermal vent metagenome TaxID=652676 RepID=A0A3B0S4R1_9ZZZZ